MRWLDIEIPTSDDNPQVTRLLTQAAGRYSQIARIQLNAGLDSPLLLRLMAEIGQLLFQALTCHDPEAMSPDREGPGCNEPEIGLPEADLLTGYQIVVPPTYLHLPWTWLHNGVGFLLERHPLCASSGSSAPYEQQPVRPWMRRSRATRLEQQVTGGRPLRETLANLRPTECADPEILFVPGHCEEAIRRLIYREADAIRNALNAGPLDRPLARLRILQEAITPVLLTRRGDIYQGLHFAGSTSEPLVMAGDDEATWLADLVNLELIGDTTEEKTGIGPALEEVAGAELDVIGVDPVTALLDAVSETVARRGSAPPPPAPPPQTTSTALAEPTWLLEDGPIQPETLGRGGKLPPLIFSNSYCSLPELGGRFLAAGASVFVGPLVPLFSRPARKFAGRFYNFMADGHSAASAMRNAALACRGELGVNHPAWLSYGTVGFGSLALQYL
ncbi:MAG: hypothetical protein ABIF77_20695 [bacterium]